MKLRAALLVGALAMSAGGACADETTTRSTTQSSDTAPGTTAPTTDATPVARTAPPSSAPTPTVESTDAEAFTSTTTSDPLEIEPACTLPSGIAERIALLVWPAVYAQDWATARRVVSDGVGGVLLMKPADWDATTLRQRLAELDLESPHGVLVATDEEGGDVQRLSGIATLASQQDVSTSASPDGAGRLIAEHAELVAALGVDVVLGPVVDVLPENGAPPLRHSRFFVGGPDAVAAYAAAYVAAWQLAGITPVLKHYPGHGGASGDTHSGAGLTAPLAEMEARDLLPYRALAQSGAGVMAGHLTTPDLSDDLPASRSAGAIEHLRASIGFGDALVVADSLDMGAVGIPVPQAAAESIGAGVDVVLYTDPSITTAVVDTVAAAVAAGTVPDERITEAATKVWRLLGHSVDGC